MSQENVAVVRAAFRAFNAGDMDALRALFDPEVIFHHPEGWPEPGPSVGRDAVLRETEQLREPWDVDTLELISDFIPVEDSVLVRVAWHARGHGPDLDQEFTHVYTLRDDKIIGIAMFWDHAEALDAVGLRE